MITSTADENRRWRIVKLGDICEKITDGTHHSPPNGPTGDFKYVTAKNIRPSGLDLTDITYVDAATHREIYSRCDVRKDDILYVKDGATTGRVALNALDEEFSLLSSVGVLRPNRNYVLPKYLLYALQAPAVKDRMLADVAGVAITRLTLKKLKAAEVPLAPLEQQGAIVAEVEKQFSRLDEAVANLKRVRANLLRYHVHVLADAADGWPTRPLGSLLREPLRNGHSAKATDDPNGLRAFTLTAVTEGDFTERNTKRTVAEPRKVADLWAQPGDIYIERSNTPELVGTARLYNGPPAFAFIPDLLIRVRVDESALSSEFAEVALRSEAARRYFRAKAQGIAGSMPKIDQGVVEAFEMPLPTLSEQECIVAAVDRRLSIVREVEADINANLQRAYTMRTTLLARAFGERSENTKCF